MPPKKKQQKKPTKKPAKKTKSQNQGKHPEPKEVEKTPEEKKLVDLQILNDAITGDAAELVHIVEVEGKGRGMVAKKDIAIGTKIVTDRPLAASIYGVEIMPIKYGFKTRMMLNFYPCSMCYRFHVQRTKQDLQYGSYCSTECKEEFIRMFGRNMHSIKSRRVQESIWRLHEEIEDRTKLFKIIKTLKLLLRLIVIKKNCPDQWSKISQLDGECKNDAVKEEVKEWMEFVVKHFSVLYPDITYAEVESTFLLAYINTWGFHVPGPDPDSQGVITGTGLYYIGSMFNHSCNPNAAFLSTCLNNEKVLVAMKDIKVGDEITCAYINCEQDREDRQGELLFGWNFLCTCERCIEEEAGEGKKIVEITCDHQGEYEAQLELATKTEQEYERKARSRIGINDYVSTI